ncbi:hypothetical protein ACH5RR_041804 [Cinchona calisaya]|uniref:Uncharacterized protein n=1 Tax=Cinchona calisaya TaxID=153742 RepID=A0ABD2XXT1_9GENT
MSDSYTDDGVELGWMSDNYRQLVLYFETEVKRLRTFLKCSEYLHLNKSEDDDELENTSFVPVEDIDLCCLVLFGGIQKILSRCKPNTRYEPIDLMDQLKILDMLCRFDKYNEVLGQEINRAYITFSDCLSKLTSPMGDVNELMELIDTILENLSGILNYCDGNFYVRFTMDAFHVRLQNLKVKLRSLKSFICIAKFRVFEHSQLENLLIHTEIFTLKAAHFLYMF